METMELSEKMMKDNSVLFALMHRADKNQMVEILEPEFGNHYDKLNENIHKN